MRFKKMPLKKGFQNRIFGKDISPNKRMAWCLLPALAVSLIFAGCAYDDECNQAAPADPLPVLSILSPPEGALFADDDSVLLSVTLAPAAAVDRYLWSSSLDGELGDEARMTVTALQPGLHTITAGVYLSGGEALSEVVQILVLESNLGPRRTLQIASPSDSELHLAGDPVTFKGLVVPDTGVQEWRWFSSLDGLLGATAEFSHSNLTIGQHLVTLNAVLMDGSALVQTSRLIIQAPPVAELPVVTIRGVSDGAEATAGDTITLEAAMDMQNDVAVWVWSSDLDGELGRGPQISVSNETCCKRTSSWI